MLTEDKERAVRIDLEAGDLSASKIAIRCGTTPNTVLTIQRGYAAAKQIPYPLKREIRELFDQGVTDRLIGQRVNLPSSVIKEFRRHLRFGKSKVETCVKCGAAVFKHDRQDRECRKVKKIRAPVSRDNARKLYDIITDLLQLEDLRLISHPLFYQLTKRAEKVYQKIHGKTKNSSQPRKVRSPKGK
jgi:IS30 family transposase